MRFLYFIIIICMFISIGCNKKDNNVDMQPNEIKPLVKNQIENEKIELNTKENNLKENENLQEKKIIAEEVETQPLVRLDTNDVKLEWNDKSGKVMSALATNFSGNQKINILELDNFTAVLYENGVKSAKLKAKKAILDINKKEVKVMTGVNLESYTNKSTLIANKVLWKSIENKIYAQDGILNTSYGKIEGKFFTLNTSLETFEISDKGLIIK